LLYYIVLINRFNSCSAGLFDSTSASQHIHTLTLVKPRLHDRAGLTTGSIL